MRRVWVSGGTRGTRGIGAAVAAALARQGRAGVGHRRQRRRGPHGADHEPEVFDEVVEVNLGGTMRVCASAHGGLKARRGCIVNAASMLSYVGDGPVPGYSAAKGGVAQLTTSRALAHAADGIRVNAVAPGWIATPLNQALEDDPGLSCRRGAPSLRPARRRWPGRAPVPPAATGRGR